MFKFESFLQPVVNTTKNTVDAMIKDEALRKSVNSFIDAQFECTKTMMAATGALGTAVYESAKSFDPVKTFIPSK
jgi:hypothetical protein